MSRSEIQTHHQNSPPFSTWFPSSPFYFGIRDPRGAPCVSNPRAPLHRPAAALCRVPFVSHGRTQTGAAEYTCASTQSSLKSFVRHARRRRRAEVLLGRPRAPPATDVRRRRERAFPYTDAGRGGRRPRVFPSRHAPRRGSLLRLGQVSPTPAPTKAGGQGRGCSDARPIPPAVALGAGPARLSSLAPDGRLRRPDDTLSQGRRERRE